MQELTSESSAAQSHAVVVRDSGPAQMWRLVSEDLSAHAKRLDRRNGILSVLYWGFWALASACSIAQSNSLVGLWLLIPGLVFHAIWVGYWSSRPTSLDKKLIDDPSNEEEALVTIWYERDGFLTGTDRGVLWVEDGALFFYGHRSSFRIPRQELRAVKRSRFLNDLSELEAVSSIATLDVISDQVRLRIGFRLLSIDGWRWESRVITDICRTALRGKPSQLDTLLPPLDVDPQFAGPTASIRSFIGIVVLSIAFLIALAMSIPFTLNWIPITICLAIVAFSRSSYALGRGWFCRLRSRKKRRLIESHESGH